MSGWIRFIDPARSRLKRFGKPRFPARVQDDHTLVSVAEPNVSTHPTSVQWNIVPDPLLSTNLITLSDGLSRITRSRRNRWKVSRLEAIETTLAICGHV